MRFHRMGAAFLALLTACSSASRYIPQDTAEDVVEVYLNAPDVTPVEVNEAEFAEALTSLVQDIEPTANPRDIAINLFYPQDSSHQWDDGYVDEDPAIVVPVVEVPASDFIEDLPPEGAQERLVDAYLSWCSRTQTAGDCLGLLDGDRGLDGADKETLAIAIALGSVLNETKEALAASIKETFEPQAILKAIVWSICAYMTLWLMPEPVSKGIAAVLTAALLSYLGVRTVWSLVGGWRNLSEDVEQAWSFEEIQSAGKEYGKNLGENAARILVMVVTVAAGGVTARLGARFGKLPASSQASKIAQAQGSVPAVAAAEVEAVAVSSQGTFKIVRSLTSRNEMINGSARVLPRSWPIGRSVGAMSRAEALARKLKLNVNSPTTRQVLNSLDDKVSDFIGQFRQGSIQRKLPSEVLEMTVEQALKHSTAVRKLLIDGRFAK